MNGSKQLFLLDPKYKLECGGDPETGGPKKGDIDKMHAYRDAIRDDAGRRILQRAAILFPGATREFSRVAAIGVRPSHLADISREIQTILDQIAAASGVQNG